MKKDIRLEKSERKLERDINLLIMDELEKLDKSLILKIYEGMILYGGF